MSQLRFVLAAVIAPLTVPITIILVSSIVGRDIWQYDDPDLWLTFWLITAFSYVGLLFGGLPIVYVLRNLQRITLGALVIAGAICGFVGCAIYLLVHGLVFKFSAQIDLLELVIGAIFGVSVASAFGLIAGVNNLREM